MQYLWLSLKKESQEKNDQKESQEKKEIACPRKSVAGIQSFHYAVLCRRGNISTLKIFTPAIHCRILVNAEKLILVHAMGEPISQSVQSAKQC